MDDDSAAAARWSGKCGSDLDIYIYIDIYVDSVRSKIFPQGRVYMCGVQEGWPVLVLLAECSFTKE